jgi:dGTPase
LTPLQPYAARQETSRGRVHAEPAAEFRDAYQRDRDRVIHSSAFRRLEYKTQVFVNHEGDMFRTRLTHSIEVAQIGRTVARALGLNEDLTEAICLAHDLGHTPFGHAGQDALDRCMADHGGFEHNLQSLRVVDLLEERYAAFPGLNLTFETREGILKHCSRIQAELLGDVGRRFIDGGQPGLEAQVANLADEIAYNNHDVDDGLRSGLITVQKLGECAMFSEQLAAVHRQWPELPGRRLVHELVRRMINHVVSDLVAESRRRIGDYRPTSIEDVRAARHPLIALSDGVRKQHVDLKRFLNGNLYRHYRVQRMSHKAERIVTSLFATFMEKELLLPREVQDRIAGLAPDRKDAERPRLIADYIAGMTDRYAIAEYQRLTDPDRIS